MDAFCEACCKELAARLLGLVIPATHVGQYPKGSGKKGGTLRRGWVAKTHKEAESGNGTPSVEQATAYANSLSITKSGGMYTIEIINPVEYASYYEFGHRTRNKKGWVEGQYTLTISEQKLEQLAPRILEQKLRNYLKEAFNV